MSKKMLVTYFSASGVTKKTATELASAIGADIFEIVLLKWLIKQVDQLLQKNAKI